MISNSNKKIYGTARRSDNVYDSMSGGLNQLHQLITYYGGVVEIPPSDLDIIPKGPLKPNEEDESVLTDIDTEVDSR
jgi:hypothetical protein